MASTQVFRVSITKEPRIQRLEIKGVAPARGGASSRFLSFGRERLYRVAGKDDLGRLGFHLNNCRAP